MQKNALERKRKHEIIYKTSPPACHSFEKYAEAQGVKDHQETDK
jgi:hypothetical protein